MSYSIRSYQIPVLVDVLLQNGQEEVEDAVHVLCQCVLDVSPALMGQSLERDHILGQPQQDQHHQLRLCVLNKRNHKTYCGKVGKNVSISILEF